MTLNDEAQEMRDQLQALRMGLIRGTDNFDRTMQGVREWLRGNGLPLTFLGTSEEEVPQLREQAAKLEAVYQLELLHAGGYDRPAYDGMVAIINSELHAVGLGLRDISTNVLELHALRPRS